MPVRRVLVTGSSGLVGQALCCFLESGGHEVRRLVRRQPDSASGEFAWDPARGEIDLAAFEGVHAVVNLAGASLVEKRWTPERMELLQSSRVASTKLVAESMTRVGTSAALLNASATGYYGDRPEGEVCESDAPGTGFLARTCVAWERAADPAREAGVRVACLRIGVVVARAGGVVGKLRTPVLLGVAGPVGSGRQGMSWIALDDLLGVVLHAIESDRYEGPINVRRASSHRQPRIHPNDGPSPATPDDRAASSLRCACALWQDGGGGPVARVLRCAASTQGTRLPIRLP